MCTLPATDDIHNVYEEVHTLRGRWSDMCIALKLPIAYLETIEISHPGNPARCLQSVLTQWLQKAYKYDIHGPPTWRSLVRAVGHPAGGNDCALAKTIAEKHLGMYM